ncbi:hypothetical protein AcV5_008673 [Taiwanofungus camphoratus]|nr:hypothetical protein AcV5_008673 [Antrodia cinnamomea]
MSMVAFLHADTKASAATHISERQGWREPLGKGMCARTPCGGSDRSKRDTPAHSIPTRAQTFRLLSLHFSVLASPMMRRSCPAISCFVHTDNLFFPKITTGI